MCDGHRHATEPEKRIYAKYGIGYICVGLNASRNRDFLAILAYVMNKLPQIRLAAAMVLGLALAVGCKKQQPPSAESLERHRPPTFNSETAPPPIVVADSGDTQANLNQLSTALRKYIAGSHRMPKDFDDFLARSGVQPPPAPPGKKYMIQGPAVVLVNQ